MSHCTLRTCCGHFCNNILMEQAYSLFNGGPTRHTAHCGPWNNINLDKKSEASSRQHEGGCSTAGYQHGGRSWWAWSKSRFYFEWNMNHHADSVIKTAATFGTHCDKIVLFEAFQQLKEEMQYNTVTSPQWIINFVCVCVCVYAFALTHKHKHHSLDFSCFSALCFFCYLVTHFVLIQTAI